MSILKKTLVNILAPHLFTQARIAGLHEASENFRFIDLQSDEFKKKKLNAGEKVQIDIGNGELRTYTPLSIDGELGTLGILAYIHGNGPGSVWAQKVKVGDSCRLFGPRPSLRLHPEEKSFVFFGDETTLSAAAGIQRRMKNKSLGKFIFESSVPEEVSSIAKDLGLQADIFSKTSKGGTSEENVWRIVNLASEFSTVILTGKAQSIQKIRNQLKTVGYPLSRVITKPYWAEGRAGLD